MGGTRTSAGLSVAVDVGGNVYTTGTFSGTVDFDPGSGVFSLSAADNSSAFSSAFVTKLDGAGKFVWARNMSGDGSSGLSVAVDVGGNVYTTGAFRGTVDFDPGGGVFSLSAAGQSSAFVTKLDSAGKFVWAKELASGETSSSGNGVAVDGSGNVYVTGLFTGVSDLDPGPGTLLVSAGGSFDSGYIAKLDSAGKFVWGRAMGGSTPDGGEVSRGVAVDDSGNVYVIGSFTGTSDFGPLSNGSPLVRTSAGSADIFVVKLDSAGNSVWVRAMGGPGFDAGTSVAVDGVGNVHVTGSFAETAIFFSRTIGTGPGAPTIVTSRTSAGGRDIFVGEISTGGFVRWVRAMGGPESDEGSSVAVDGSGNVYTTGHFQGKVDFDPSADVYNVISVGVRDAFLNKLDSDGRFEWVRYIGGSGEVVGAGVAVDGGGNTYTTGEFTGTTHFDLDPFGVFSGGTAVAGSLTSLGSQDIYVAKFHDPGETGAQPLISEGGIVLATLLPTVNSISPRSIISVFGQNFSTTTTLFPELDSNGNLARALGGTCLEMNGVRLPIFAMTPEQINAQASASQVFGPASFRVITNCNTANALFSESATITPRALSSDVETVTVETATPGFFLFPPLADDGLIAARFNADAVAVAPAGMFNDEFGPSRPAKPGDIVLLFGTGWGPTTAAFGTGQLATAAAQLLPNANPMVSFGGIFLAQGDVLYVGVTPNTAGLYQLAIRVPAVAIAGNYPVVLTVYGKSTPLGPVIPVALP